MAPNEKHGSKTATRSNMSKFGRFEVGHKKELNIVFFTAKIRYILNARGRKNELSSFCFSYQPPEEHRKFRRLKSVFYLASKNSFFFLCDYVKRNDVSFSPYFNF